MCVEQFISHDFSLFINNWHLEEKDFPLDVKKYVKSTICQPDVRTFKQLLTLAACC